jgi:phage shock protein B
MEGVLAILCIFVALPAIIFHYVTVWKKSGGITQEDERLLDELHDLARRLTDRVNTIERIIAADNPGFRPQITPPAMDEDYGSHADELDAIRSRLADRTRR